MLIEVPKSKIHRVKLTDTNLNYIGCITKDKKLINADDIVVGEKFQVVNINNSGRFETNVIEGKENNGDVTLNGPAIRKVVKGDPIIYSYAQMCAEETQNFKPTVVFQNEVNNKLS